MKEKECPVKQAYDPEILPDLLPLYYKRLFPHAPFYRWLSYGNVDSTVFTHREFSFTLAGDIYLRYQSFENQSEFEEELCSKNPTKFDIGPVMTVRPRDHRSVPTMTPTQRELVFDIDMTDYDEVRTCCSGASVCQKCWKFMSIACKILDAALRMDFGFEHILWVFSGRRGIHCWVCDETARRLDNKGRSAVAEYLTLVNSGEVSRVNIGEKMHHSVRRAYRTVESLFEEVILKDQNFFATEKGILFLLKSVTDEEIRKELDGKLKVQENNSTALWNCFTKYMTDLRHRGSLPRKLQNIVEEVKLALLYPRLDVNVTKGMNHLLKSPFCVHPGTGKVCVPINPAAANNFDPTTAPTITQILDEISAFDEKNTQSQRTTETNRIKVCYTRAHQFRTLFFEA
ncbi:DNA primase small subunit, partial [Pseudolycoriella hygida]